MKKENRSYYEELRENIGNTDYENYQPLSVPSGENGYIRQERKIVYLLCSFFLVFLAFARFSQLGGYLSRDRELTLQNYNDYVNVNIYSTTVSNPQSYEIVVKAKKAIVSAKLDVTVFYFKYGDDFTDPAKTKQVSFSVDSLPKGDTYSYVIHFETIVFCQNVRVVAIEGRLP